MDQNEITKKQLESAKKGIEWMEVSKPSVAAREISVDASTADGSFPSGKAMCPHERHIASDQRGKQRRPARLVRGTRALIYFFFSL